MDTLTQPLVLFTLSLISTLVLGYFFADLPIASTHLTPFYLHGILITSILGGCASLAWGFICYRCNGYRLFIVALAFFTGAFLFANDLRRSTAPGYFASLLGEERLEAVVKGKVVSAPIPYESGWAFEIIATHIDDAPLKDETSSHLRIFYPLTTFDLDAPEALLPLPGDHIEGYLRLERFAQADMPGDISMRQFMENRGLAARANAREALLVTTPTSLTTRQHIERWLAARRIHLEHEIGRRLPADQAAVTMGMLTASRGLITAEFRHPFDLTGTSHLLAISGLHLAVLAGILWFTLGWIIGRVPWLLLRFGKKRVCGPAVVFLLITYVIMIGAPVSAQRALVMLVVAILGYTALRPFCGVHAVALAALLLTLMRPTILFELGFQLSFLATAGIILFMRSRPKWLRKPEPGMQEDSRFISLLRRFGSFACISCSATLSTWPAIVLITGELPVAGLWLNLIVVPAFSVAIFPVMAASAILLSLLPSVATPLLYLSSLSITWMQQGLDIAAYWPGSTIRVGNPMLISWLSGTVSIAVLILGGLSRRAILIILSSALLACIPPWIAHKTTSAPITRVHFIPVGQGDATLVQFPDGTSLLVDAGGTQMGADPGLQRVLPYLKSLGIRRLDYVLVSHAHQDHIGGITALIRPFRPRYFLYDANETSPQLTRITASMQKNGTELWPVENTASISINDDITVRVIRPGGPERGSTNDMSLVTSFQYAGAAVLLPGDIEEPGESWLLENGLQAHTIVKLPHHGSKTSSTPPFLHAVQPRIAVAPVGKHNQFNHPHPDVIDRYLKLGASVFRTDKNGLIIMEITPDGHISIRTMR